MKDVIKMNMRQYEYATFFYLSYPQNLDSYFIPYLVVNLATLGKDVLNATAAWDKASITAKVLNMIQYIYIYICVINRIINRLVLCVVCGVTCNCR